MDLISRIKNYLSGYMAFPDTSLPLTLAFWAMATHLYDSFDAFPYLVITAATKQAGKTRLSELVGFLSRNTKNAATMSPSSLFRIIQDAKPTVIFDEAETFSQGTAGDMRSVLNAGYRKGQTVMRTQGFQVVEFHIYSPKVFVLIGDVYDTLRDRSIVVTLRRGEPAKRFSYDDAKDEGAALAAEFLKVLEAHKEAIEDAYQAEAADYLGDRDEEIWRPLFAICRVIAPHYLSELQRASADLSADKTQERKRFVNLSKMEDDAQADQYARRAVRDLLEVLNGDNFLPSGEAVKRMRDLNLGPWRRYQGEGLTPKSLANMLSRFGLRPRPGRKQGNRKSEGAGQGTARGYYKADVEKAQQ